MRSRAFILLALGACFTGRPAAAEAPKPDPAMHTVIVPYDDEKNPSEAKPNRFYLDYADFQRLWDLAKENRRPDKPLDDTGEPAATIASALYDAEVIETGLRVKARFSVATRGRPWAKLALPFKSGSGTLAVSRVALDGHATAFDDGVVLIEQPGTHTVDATLEITLGRGWKEALLTLPAATAAAMTVTVPASDGRPQFADGQGRLVTEERRGERRAFTLPLSNSTAVGIMRSPSLRLVSDAPPAFADTRVELHVLPRMERVVAETSFDFAGTERTGVSVELDPALRLESVGSSPEGTVTLRKEGARQVLDVAFLSSVAESARVSFVATRVLDDKDAEGERQSPFVHAVAQRESTLLELLSADEVQVKPETAPDADRVASRAQPPSGETVVGAWKLKPGATFPYVTLPPQDRSVAKLETLHQLGVQKAEIIAAITLDTGRTPLRGARIGVPAGFEVQALTGPRVQSWHREGDEVLVRFDEQPERQARLVLHVARTLAQPSATWTLEALRLPEFAKRETTVLIAVHAADDVKLTFDGADRTMREADPRTLRSDITVSDPMQVKRALQVTKADWTAQVTFARQAPRFSVDAVLLAQAGDLGIHLSQQVGVTVEQGALATVKLRLPADLPEARVRGAGVRDVQSRIVNDVREYDVSFQTEALDRADFTLDLDLPLEGEKVLPVLQVDGAARTRRFVIVDNAGSREMKLESGGADSATKEAIPWLPDGLTRPKYFRMPDQAEIKLAFTQLESTAGNAAIVTLAEITTALRPNGERWETVVYSLSNRSLQFLPVRLPAGAELVEVSVGGQNVRADKADSGQQKTEGRNPEYLVPLIQMRAGELSEQVRLVYRVPARGEGVASTHKLDDPELIGLSAERTLWNVWVPDGYEARSFDGNMDEVGQEGHELEKQRSLLSEVARLNRVLSSSESEYKDAKMAYDNASKAISDLKRSGSAKPGKVSTADDDKPMEKKVQAIKADVEKQIAQQDELIARNAGNLSQLEGKDKERMTRLHKSVDEMLFDDGRLSGDNNWNWNGAVSARGDNRTAFQVSSEPATLINDNASVNSVFLGKTVSGAGMTKVGSGSWVISGESTAVVAPKPGSGALANLSNARGNAVAQNQLAQVITDGAASPAEMELRGGIQGNLTFSGGRTMTIDDSTLTLGGPVTLNSSGITSSAAEIGGGVLENRATANFGTGSLDSSGARTLTLSGANTYTGTTAIIGGTLSVGGTGGVRMGGVVPLDSGGVVLSNGEQMLDQARHLARSGRYEESRQLALAAANAGAGSGAVKFMEQLDNADRYEPALSPGKAASPAAVENHLQLGYSAYNLGDYANAMTEFQSALRLDPQNSAARRGMERAEAKRSEYFDTARDHLRARMLNEVNRGFENIDGLKDVTASGVLPGHGTATPAQVPHGMTPQVTMGGDIRMAPAAPAAVDPFAPAAVLEQTEGVRNGIVGGWATTATEQRITFPAANIPGDKQALPWALADGALPAQAQAPGGPNALFRNPGFGDLVAGIGDAANQPLTAQLKTVGRVSLPVEVPLSGTVYHFSKVKDHAALDVTVVKPWEPREKAALWALLIGLALLCLARFLPGRAMRWRRPPCTAAQIAA